MRLTKTTVQNDVNDVFSGMYVGKDEPEPIPLTGVDIAVKIYDFAARVTVTQGYRNIEAKPIEAVYSFPLPESAAVCGFEVETNDRKLVGKVEENEQANKLYDEALETGQGAFLLEQDRPNIFTANIGNLLPHSAAVVKISYVQELNFTAGALRLLIPTTISPRYVPLEQLKQMDPVELDHINPPIVVGHLPYGLRLTVEIDLKNGVKSITSPSHSISVGIQNNQAQITLSGDDVQLDRDFVLNIEPQDVSQPVIRCAKDRENYAMMLSFIPDKDEQPSQNSEIIFILDRSGSMDGESIAEARRALQICLHALQAGDRFNIISFGSTYQCLFPESVEYSQSNMDIAINNVARYGADLGGTEIYKPLVKALKSRTILPKRIILITDGEFGNEEAVINLCQNYKNEVAIFPIGIGSGVNQYALNAIARVTGGVAEFIHPHEHLEPRVIAQFRRLRAKASRKLLIDWGLYSPGTMVPPEIPAFFQGDSLIIYKTVTALQPSSIRIFFDQPENSHSWVIDLDQQDLIQDDIIPTLMARRRIQLLEEELIFRLERDKRKKIEQAIIELACSYGLMSSQTSYIAIESRPETEQAEQAEYRRVPIALTQGWGHITCDNSVMKTNLIPCFIRQNYSLMENKKFITICDQDLINVNAAKLDAIQASKSFEECLTLINLQKAEGYWELNREFRLYLNTQAPNFYEELETLRRQFTFLTDEARATVYALYLLDQAFTEYSDQWQMVADKGFQWLERQGVNRETFQKIVAILKRTAPLEPPTR